VLNVRVHIANEGWKKYTGIERGVKNPIIGSVGKSQAIEAINIAVTKRPDSAKNKKLYFKVHQAQYGWKDWTKEGFTSGSDGLSLQLEAIKIKIE
jgi:uncharacterized protein YjdB